MKKEKFKSLCLITTTKLEIDLIQFFNKEFNSNWKISSVNTNFLHQNYVSHLYLKSNEYNLNELVLYIKYLLIKQLVKIRFYSSVFSDTLNEEISSQDLWELEYFEQDLNVFMELITILLNLKYKEVNDSNELKLKGSIIKEANDGIFQDFIKNSDSKKEFENTNSFFKEREIVPDSIRDFLINYSPESYYEPTHFEIGSVSEKCLRENSKLYNKRCLISHELGHIFCAYIHGYKFNELQLSLLKGYARGDARILYRKHLPNFAEVKNYLKARKKILLAGAVFEGIETYRHNYNTNKLNIILKYSAKSDYCKYHLMMRLLLFVQDASLLSDIANFIKIFYDKNKVIIEESIDYIENELKVDLVIEGNQLNSFLESLTTP